METIALLVLKACSKSLYDLKLAFFLAISTVARSNHDLSTVDRINFKIVEETSCISPINLGLVEIRGNRYIDYQLSRSSAKISFKVTPMKIYKSHKTIILGYLSTAIALGLFSAKTVNAQTKLNSVPEIGWSIRLTSFELDRQNLGQVFTFRCPTAPESSIYSPVWGTDTYTLNSGLCNAAVHAGMITRDGGLINIELTAGESNYQGSDRFGVSSKNHAPEDRSFRFIGNPIAIESDEANHDSAENKPPRQPSTIERTVGNGVRRGIERTISDSIRDIFR